MNYRRVLYIIFFLIFIFFIEVSVYISILYRSDYIKIISSVQYKKNIIVPLKRYNIYDRNSILLAGNISKRTLYAIPQIIKEDKIKQKIYKLFPQAHLLFNANSKFCYLKRHLEERDIEDFFKKNPDLKDYVYIMQEDARYYTFNFLEPLIGNVDVDNRGISGLEYAWNNFLLEKRTFSNVFCNAKSEIYSDFYKQDSKKKLDLSIDVILSEKIYGILSTYIEKQNANFGYVLVMDGKTGEVEVAVMSPYSNFKDNPGLFTESYELGSVFKAFCALAALDEKVVCIDEMIDCHNKKTSYVNKRKINTWKAASILTFKEVMKNSNNIGIAQVALRLNEKLYNHYAKLEFSEKTGVEVSGEATGFLNPPNKWSKHSIISLSYGYEVSASLIQLAKAFSVILNEGFMVSPTLLKGKKVEKKQIYKKESIDQLRDILKFNKEESFLLKRIQSDIFGKTGTSELLKDGLYQKDKNGFTFLGSMEYKDLKKIIVVYLQADNNKNRYASAVAFPLFVDIVAILEK